MTEWPSVSSLSELEWLTLSGRKILTVRDLNGEQEGAER